jgi:hypothetical protein
MYRNLSDASVSDFIEGVQHNDEGMGNLIWYTLGMLRGKYLR